MDRGRRPRLLDRSTDIVIGVDSAVGAVDELVDDHHLAGMDVVLQGADRTGSDDRTHAKGVQRPDVGPIWNAVSDEVVIRTMAWQERNVLSRQRPDRDRPSVRTVWCVDHNLLPIRQEFVESGSADHAHQHGLDAHRLSFARTRRTVTTPASSHTTAMTMARFRP